MPSIRLVLSFCLAAVTLLAGGCEKSESRCPRSARNVPKKVAPKPGPEVLVRVSEDEARAFAAKLEAAFLAHDSKPFDELIDWKTMGRRATEAFSVSSRTRANMAKEAERWQTGQDFLAQLWKNDNESTFKLVNIRDVSGATWATFRAAGADGLREYTSFLLTRRDKKVVGIEMYMYAKGQTLSNTYRDALMIDFAKELTSAEDDIDPRLIEYRMHIGTLERMVTHKLRNEPLDGLAAYDALPGLIKREKTVLLMRFQMAAALGGDALESACRDFRAAYPEDPCIAFLMLTYLSDRGRMLEALEMIDKIDLSVGGDPYLHAMRANIASQQGDTQKARHHAELALRALPDMADPYWSMVDVALLDRDHKLLSELLLKLQREFHFDLSDVPLSPVYAEFLDSEPGREWLALQTEGMGTFR
jgi:hypothetical protein